jgi:hypothetical protein
MTIKRNPLLKIMYPLLGLGTLLWFIVRVVPKPSRASYPCMRVAAPIASTFVVWLIGISTGSVLLKQMRTALRQSRYGLALSALVMAGMAGVIGFSMTGNTAVIAVHFTPNAPIGTAKGIMPGRVVWLYDSTVSNWKGLGDGHWWESNHTFYGVASTMLSSTLQTLTAKASDSAAWDTLFRYFNQTHLRGNKGYSKGEKISIKVNFVGCGRIPSWCGVDTNTLELYRKIDYMNVSPQMMHALLGELITIAGVEPTDISIGDPSAYFPGQFFDTLKADFPGVNFIDCKGILGRTKAKYSRKPMYWSSRPTGVIQDYLTVHDSAATYIINMSGMKSHAGAGITLCAKNNYGSIIRLPADSGYYDLHQTLAYVDSQMGSYRALVDLMGQADLGGKTMLYLADGLYSGNHNYDTVPHKWPVPPFNGGWSSSVFASQDPVAIESVLLDLFQLDTDSYRYPEMAGVEDYMIEAAEADNPPSGTFYDPNHQAATSRLPSLGVHEHWNNAVERKYSRNLGTGNGIELVSVEGASSVVRNRTVTNRTTGYELRRNSASGNLELSVPGASDLEVGIYDSRGRMLGKTNKEYHAAGHYQLKLQSLMGGSAPLASGNYVFAVYDRKAGDKRLVAENMMRVSK